MAYKATDRRERVEIPAYTDRWMRGDRYGVVTGIHENASPNKGDCWMVKLDKSRATIKVYAIDCRLLD